MTIPRPPSPEGLQPIPSGKVPWIITEMENMDQLGAQRKKDLQGMHQDNMEWLDSFFASLPTPRSGKDGDPNEASSHSTRPSQEEETDTNVPLVTEPSIPSLPYARQSRSPPPPLPLTPPLPPKRTLTPVAQAERKRRRSQENGSLQEESPHDDFQVDIPLTDDEGSALPPSEPKRDEDGAGNSARISPLKSKPTMISSSTSPLPLPLPALQKSQPTKESSSLFRPTVSTHPLNQDTMRAEKEKTPKASPAHLPSIPINFSIPPRPTAHAQSHKTPSGLDQPLYPLLKASHEPKKPSFRPTSVPNASPTPEPTPAPTERISNDPFSNNDEVTYSSKDSHARSHRSSTLGKVPSLSSITIGPHEGPMTIRPSLEAFMTPGTNMSTSQEKKHMMSTSDSQLDHFAPEPITLSGHTWVEPQRDNGPTVSGDTSVERDKVKKEKDEDTDEDDTEWKQRDIRGPSGTDILRKKLSMLRATLNAEQMERGWTEQHVHAEVPLTHNPSPVADEGREQEWRRVLRRDSLIDRESSSPRLHDRSEEHLKLPRREPSFNPMFDTIPPNSGMSRKSIEMADEGGSPHRSRVGKTLTSDTSDIAVSPHPHPPDREVLASPGIISQARVERKERRGFHDRDSPHPSGRRKNVEMKESPMVASLDVGYASMSPGYSKTQGRRERWDGIPWDEEANTWGKDDTPWVMDRSGRPIPAQEAKQGENRRKPKDSLGLELSGRGRGKGQSLVLKGVKQLDEMNEGEEWDEKKGTKGDGKDKGIFTSPAFGRSQRRRRRIIQRTQSQGKRSRAAGPKNADEADTEEAKEDRLKKKDPFKTPVGRQAGAKVSRMEQAPEKTPAQAPRVEQISNTASDQMSRGEQLSSRDPDRLSRIEQVSSEVSAQVEQGPGKTSGQLSRTTQKPAKAFSHSSRIESVSQQAPAKAARIIEAASTDSGSSTGAVRPKKILGASLLSKFPITSTSTGPSKQREASVRPGARNHSGCPPTKTSSKLVNSSQESNGSQGGKTSGRGSGQVVTKTMGKNMGSLPGSGKPRTIPPIRSLMLASATAKKQEQEKLRREQLQRQRERARLEEGARRGKEVEDRRKAEEKRREEDRRKAEERKEVLAGTIRKGGGLLVGANTPTSADLDKPITSLGVGKQLLPVGERKEKGEERRPVPFKTTKRTPEEEGFRTMEGERQGNDKSLIRQGADDDISDQELNMEWTGPIRSVETNKETVSSLMGLREERVNEDEEGIFIKAPDQEMGNEEDAWEQEGGMEEETSILTEGDPQEIKSIVMTRKLSDGNVVHELPDIESEPSEEEGAKAEEREIKAKPKIKAKPPTPSWAKGDRLDARLAKQAKINPDSIFGVIQPLHLPDIFKGRHAGKFRPRSSSAHWEGPDKLTRQEEENYRRRMGYL